MVDIFELFRDYFERASQITVYKNTLLDILLSITLVPIIFGFLYVLKKIVGKKLHDSAREDFEKAAINNQLNTFNTIKSELIGIGSSLNKTSMFLIAFYISTRNLQMPYYLDFVFSFIIFGTLAYVIAKFATKLINVLMDRKESQSQEDTRHLTEFFKLVLKIIAISLISLWFLSNLGINVDSFIAGLGITGIAIALALQGTITDLIASVTLYFDKPFEIGDFVVLGEDAGTIEKIGLRSTQIRSIEGHLLVIANQELLTSRINNYKKMEKRRVVQQVGVDYETSNQNLEEIPEYVEQIVSKTPNAEFDRAHFKNFGDFALIYEIVYFIDSRDYKTYLDARQHINLKILKKFEEQEISMPFPTQKLNLQLNRHKDKLAASINTNGN